MNNNMITKNNFCNLKSFQVFEKLENSLDNIQISKQNIVEIHSFLIQNLLCLYCGNLAVNPKMCPNCEMLICNKCSSKISNIKQETFCKYCNQPLIRNDISKSLERNLNNLKIKCPSSDEHCKEVINYMDIINHLNICNNWDGFSRCCLCNYIDRTKNMENNHLNVCAEIQKNNSK